MLEISLSEYWDEHVEGVFVDKIKDDDRELLQIKKVWQMMAPSVEEPENKSKTSSKASPPKARARARRGGRVVHQQESSS